MHLIIVNYVAVSTLIMMSFEDFFPLTMSNSTAGRKLLRDCVIPFILVPILLTVATISETVLIIVMVVIGMGALYVQSRPRQKNRSIFFFAWTLSSALWMFLIFEIGIMTLYEITQMEHLVLLILFSATSMCFYTMKAVADFELATGSSKGKEYSPVLTSESHYCQICQIEVNEKFFHSIWFNCCIMRVNYLYFLCGQVFAFATLIFFTYLGVTSLCQPTKYVFFDKVLYPGDCSTVYCEFSTALDFATCIYAGGCALVIAVLLLYHTVVYIPKYFGLRWRSWKWKKTSVLTA